MSEMELIADHLVIITKGRLLADAPLQEFVQSHSGHRVTVGTHAGIGAGPDPDQGGGTVSCRSPLTSRSRD